MGGQAGRLSVIYRLRGGCLCRHKKGDHVVAFKSSYFRLVDRKRRSHCWHIAWGIDFAARGLLVARVASCIINSFLNDYAQCFSSTRIISVVIDDIAIVSTRVGASNIVFVDPTGVINVYRCVVIHINNIEAVTIVEVYNDHFAILCELILESLIASPMSKCAKVDVVYGRRKI